MFHLKNIDEHLDSNEKIIRFFRPSRRAYILHYMLYLLLLIIALYLSFYNNPGSAYYIFWAFVNLISKIVVIFILIMIIRLEYRIWSRRYALTNERLLYSRGIFSEVFHSSSYHNITDIAFQQTFWDKIMNTGSLKVDTAGTDSYEIRYRKVHDPLAIKKIINDNQSIKVNVPKKKRVTASH